MARPTADTEQVTFRLPKDLLRRAGKLATYLSRPGMPASRTDALRAAIAVGLEKLEDDQRGAEAAIERLPVVAAGLTRTGEGGELEGHAQRRRTRQHQAKPTK